VISLDLGECRDLDPGVFRPDPGELHATQRARDICARCRVRLECLALALRTDNLDGIWGGMTAAERERYTHADLGSRDYGRRRAPITVMSIR